jgi:glyoxylase-like metal-dependent hydrolase (beta-lactamase superfamily II)
VVEHGRGLAAVAAVRDPRAVSGALVTHYHADHAGGAAAASAAGLTVLGSRETASALRVPDEDRTSLAVARAAAG